MLSEFLTTHRETIIANSRGKVASRAAPRATPIELEAGVPLFLDQLVATLRIQESTGAAHSDHQIGLSAARHGNVLHKIGFTELRNLLSNSMLAFEVLKGGSVGVGVGVGVGGSTGTVLGRNLTRMRDLIDCSLAEERLKAGIKKRERVPLAEFIEEVEVAATIEAKARGLQLTVTPVPQGVSVEVDRQTLAAAVANLLQNAFKFTRPAGHVLVRTHADADRVFIAIEDECGGLAGRPEDLFALFEQRSKDRSGLGLGLGIARQGVSANGGEIKARNIAGRGCIFTVDLPRLPLDAAGTVDAAEANALTSRRGHGGNPPMQGDRPPVLHPQEGPNAPPPGGPAPAVFGGAVGALALLAGARVLVVEDDDDARELICALVKRAGATVMCVESVAQAMEGVYRLFDPDVVVTDFSMPDADGFDLIREFRKSPSTRAVAVPILFLSGHSEDNWHARALEAGAADVLTKPFDPALLIAWIAGRTCTWPKRPRLDSRPHTQPVLTGAPPRGYTTGAIAPADRVRFSRRRSRTDSAPVRSRVRSAAAPVPRQGRRPDSRSPCTPPAASSPTPPRDN